jgi:hypothetical protein
MTGFGDLASAHVRYRSAIQETIEAARRPRARASNDARAL